MWEKSHGGKYRARLSRELRAQSFAALTVINCPTTVRFSSDGFDRKVEIDPNTGKMYTTHGGARLAMFVINEQGAAVRPPSLYIDGHNYYIVSDNGDNIYTVEDLKGNTYTCKKYPSGHVEFVE